MTEQILDIASEVQEYINKSYMYFANKFLNIGYILVFNWKQKPSIFNSWYDNWYNISCIKAREQ